MSAVEVIEFLAFCTVVTLLYTLLRDHLEFMARRRELRAMDAERDAEVEEWLANDPRYAGYEEQRKEKSE